MSDRHSSQDNSTLAGTRALPRWRMHHHTADQKSAVWWCIKVQESLPKQTRHPVWLDTRRLKREAAARAAWQRWRERVRPFNGRSDEPLQRKLIIQFLGMFISLVCLRVLVCFGRNYLVTLCENRHHFHHVPLPKLMKRFPTASPKHPLYNRKLNKLN